MLKRVIALFMLVIVSGCAGLDTKPEQFKINISSMQMLESTLMEQRYQVKLRIMNRSKESLSIDGLSFDIELNDKDFASGVSDEKFKLEPLSETLVSVTVTSTIFGLIRQFKSLEKNQTKTFYYSLSGRIYTSSGLFGIPFNEKGEIDLN